MPEGNLQQQFARYEKRKETVTQKGTICSMSPSKQPTGPELQPPEPTNSWKTRKICSTRQTRPWTVITTGWRILIARCKIFSNQHQTLVCTLLSELLALFSYCSSPYESIRYSTWLYAICRLTLYVFSLWGAFGISTFSIRIRTTSHQNTDVTAFERWLLKVGRYGQPALWFLEHL